MNKSKVVVSIAVITLSIRIVVGFILTLYGVVGAIAINKTEGMSAIMVFLILFSLPGVLISISGLTGSLKTKNGSSVFGLFF